MKTTIKFKGQDKLTVIDNVKVAQQRMPMYLVSCGETHYRYNMDDIEWTKEEGIGSVSVDVVSDSETDAPKPKADGKGAYSGKTSNRNSETKNANIDLSKLEGRLNLAEGREFDETRKGYSKGEIAAMIQKILGCGQSWGYKIVEQFIAEKRIRRSRFAKGSKCWDVVDPVLNPIWKQDYEETRDDPDSPFYGKTVEEGTAQIVKEEYY